MNIALTYFCNQKCPYCFAQDAILSYRGLAASREMGIPNLKKVLNFMKNSGIERFNMIGGEPTLHPEFEKIYDIITGCGLSVTIFSNGVIDKQRVEFLAEKDNLINVLVNIRTPVEYSKKDWKKILFVLSQLNKKVILSYRIYKIDFDLTFLFDLIDRYQLKRLINLAIACPSLVSDNVHPPLEKHREIVERMVEFSYESKKRNIRWYPDYGFILCAFTKENLKKLKMNTGFVPLTNCYPPIEVAPDLRVFRCFGLASQSKHGLKITDFKNLQEAERYFFSRSLVFKRIGALEKCFKCRYLINQKCGGGCMVHILKRLPRYQNLTPIF